MNSQISQNQWIFANYSGLNFSTNPPSVLTHSNIIVCSAEICDNNGALLFYTDGSTIYNSSHVVMANGTGLHGSTVTPSQNCVIIKKPSSNSLYYVFTTASPLSTNLFPGLKYSVVDMSLSGGNGSVTVKNNLLLNGVNQAITSAVQCNGTDFWVIAHKDTGNTFAIFPVNSTGVSNTPIFQNIGFNAGQGIFYPNNILTVSPNQKRLTHTNQTTVCNVYDFDNSTGILSNPISLSGNFNKFYQCFSPDCSKLYGTSSVQQPFRIEQFDLCAGTTTGIQNSRTEFTCTAASLDIQLGRNGKIYVGRIYDPFLGVINNPNNPAAFCNYVDQGVSLLPQQSWGHLPQFTPQYPKGNLPFNFSFSSNMGPCQFVQFQSPILLGGTYGPCPASQFTLQSLQWDFGDPLSGANNTSFLSNPTHTFISTGTYTVKLILDFGCGYGLDTLKQVVSVTNSCFSISTQSITCASLGSATISNLVNPNGAFSYTWMPVNQTGSVAANLIPGNYTVFIYDNAINFTHTLTTVLLPLVPLTGNVSNSSSVTCNGAATGTGAVSNLAGGSGNQFYLWTNGTISYTTASTNSLSAGIWSVNVTDALTACQINQSFFITQPPPLVLNLSSNTPTACAGGSIALTGTNSGGTPGYTYTWTNAPPSNTSVVSESVAGSYVYTLASLDANQCLSSNTIALNFITNPVLSVPDVSICPLKFGTLTASGAASYTWTLSSSPPSTTLGVTLVDNPLTDTQYTVVGSALGCTSIATASIILYPSPVPVIQSNSPRCEGTSLDVNASGGSIYQWSGPSSFNSNLPFNTITNLALNHGGTYNLTVTSVNGCTASTSANLVVNPIPTVSAAGSTVCTSQTLSLFANSVVGANFSWNGPLFVSAVQNPTLANPALNKTGTYSVIATSISGCTNMATAQVSVTSPPNLSVALSSNSLCAQAFNGSPNTITLTGIGANTYTLYTPNILGSMTPPIPSTSVFATPPFSSSLAIGTATLQGSNGVCTSTAGFAFTVIPNPTVGVNSYTPVICAGQNFTYTSNGANSYVWTATTPNYTTYSNGGVAVAHPSINAVFSVYGSSLGCNSALQTSSITVNPIPTLTLSAGSNSICLNENTKLSVAGTGTSFTWMPATGLSNTTASAVVASPLSSQNYTALVSVANCTNVANLFLTVLPLPKPIIDIVTPAVCLNGQISFKGSGGLLYEWRGPDHLYIQGQNPVFEALSSSYAGNYTLTVTDINGCKSSTLTTVEILPAPSGYLTNFKEETCAPYCTTFNFLSSDKNKAVRSSWMINDQFLNGNTFSYCFSSAGAYTINGTFFDETTNCKNTTSYLLNVHSKPKADFIFSPKQPIEGQDEVLFSNTSSGDGNLSFNWYFNDNKGFSTEHKNTSYLYNEPGEYKVVLVSKNQWKCADTIMKIVKVESDFALYVPNAFTPNGDERNDVFLPVVRSVKKYDLKIFDRWGKMIFQTTDPNQGWDGTFNGVMCKQDVYVWKIHVVSMDGKEKSETGNVTSLPSE